MTEHTTPRQRIGPRVSISLDTSKGANQADRAGADINTIVAQYRKSGTLPRVARTNPLYADFTFGTDMHETREAFYEAEQRFQALPADVRTLCDNDPLEFIERFADSTKLQEMVDAGLQVEGLTPTPTPPPPIPEPATPPDVPPSSPPVSPDSPTGTAPSTPTP